MVARPAFVGAWSWWALSLVASLLVAGCGEPDLTCSPPAGSIATEGTFSVNFIGETATVQSDTMQVRVIPKDVGAIDVWACQERGDEMWIVEVSVTRPSTVALPAAFAFSSSAPRVSAQLSRYDQYQLMEEQLGEGLNARVTGNLLMFDDTQGALGFVAQLSEPCGPVRCQADDRRITLDAVLSWETAP